MTYLEAKKRCWIKMISGGSIYIMSFIPFVSILVKSAYNERDGSSILVLQRHWLYYMYIKYPFVWHWTPTIDWSSLAMSYWLLIGLVNVRGAQA
jgi:hypothetical protein